MQRVHAALLVGGIRGGRIAALCILQPTSQVVCGRPRGLGVLLPRGDGERLRGFAQLELPAGHGSQFVGIARLVTNLTRTMEFLPSAFLRERKSLLGEHKPKN